MQGPVVVALACALVGCGRLGFEVVAGASDTDAALFLPAPDATAFEGGAPADASPGETADVAPARDAATGTALPLTFTIDSLRDCVEEAAPAVGQVLTLEPGRYALVAVGGAFSYTGERECWWAFDAVVFAETWTAPRWLNAAMPMPPLCPERPQFFPTAAAEGRELTFDVDTVARVGFFVPDTNCGDNVGSMQVRLERR